MNHLRKVCATVVLILALALPAFAGWIHIGKDEPPPPPTSPATTQSHIQIGVAPTDPATEVALSLLQSVLSLF